MKKDTIFGIVMLIWFLGSIVAIFWTSTTEYAWLMPAIFGQIFCIFSCMFIIPKIKEKSFAPVDYLLFLFPLLGIGCIAYSFLKHYASERFWSACVSALAPILLFVVVSVFAIVGIILLVVGYKKTIAIRKQCTLKIEARCIEVRENYDFRDNGSSTTYCPVFEFYYNGHEFRVCDNIFSNVVHYSVGEYYEIYIDPYCPTYFYEPNKNLRVGLIFFLLGGISTYLPLSLIVEEIMSRL